MSGIAPATEKLKGWREARRRAGRMLVALDFDGTLAHITDRPEQAELLPAAGFALGRLVVRPDTDVAVVSGRGLEDVRSRVGLDAIYYAGNHGMEIEGPGIQRRHPEAAAARPRLVACMDSIREALASVEGVVIEDKDLTLSVHYRGVAADSDRALVRERVRERCGREPALRLTEGKMVLEIRPAVDWDKGRATRFLLDALALGDTDAPAVFIGDDRTDEDAFRVVRDRGDGVLVTAEPAADTAATAHLASPDDVARLLAALAEPD